MAGGKKKKKNEKHNTTEYGEDDEKESKKKHFSRAKKEVEDDEGEKSKRRQSRGRDTLDAVMRAVHATSKEREKEKAEASSPPDSPPSLLQTVEDSANALSTMEGHLVEDSSSPPAHGKSSGALSSPRNNALSPLSQHSSSTPGDKCAVSPSSTSPRSGVRDLSQSSSAVSMADKDHQRTDKMSPIADGSIPLSVHSSSAAPGISSPLTNQPSESQTSAFSSSLLSVSSTTPPPSPSVSGASVSQAKASMKSMRSMQMRSSVASASLPPPISATNSLSSSSSSSSSPSSSVAPTARSTNIGCDGGTDFGLPISLSASASIPPSSPPSPRSAAKRNDGDAATCHKDSIAYSHSGARVQSKRTNITAVSRSSSTSNASLSSPWRSQHDKRTIRSRRGNSSASKDPYAEENIMFNRGSEHPTSVMIDSHLSVSSTVSASGTTLSPAFSRDNPRDRESTPQGKRKGGSWTRDNCKSDMSYRPMGDMVKLNVGGRIFYTTLSTLTREKDSMLAAMFGGDFMPWRDEQGCFFIDRDGTHFGYILNYLRDLTVLLPEDDMQKMHEIVREVEFYQLQGLLELIHSQPRWQKLEYLTIRYLPANTYDGWPIRIEGPLESHIISELNGGQMPPERESPVVKNMYGQASTGWKLRGVFLTKIFNIIAKHGWYLCTSNGSGGGKQRNFAEMYVFRRPRLMRRNKCMENKRDSSSYNYSSLFPPSQDEHDEQRLNVMNAYESEVDRHQWSSSLSRSVADGYSVSPSLPTSSTANRGSQSTHHHNPASTVAAPSPSHAFRPSCPHGHDGDMERRTEREEGLDRGGHISPPPSAFSGGCGNHNHPYHSQTDTDTTGVLVHPHPTISPPVSPVATPPVSRFAVPL